MVRSHKVEDETAWFNVGDEVESDYFTLENINLGMSYSNDIEDYFKIAGLTFFHD